MNIEKRLKEIDERKLEIRSLLEGDAETDLDAMEKELTEIEIKHLVIDKKWIRTIEGRIIEEVDRIPTRLSNRIKELITRYSETLPEIEKFVGDAEG